jgi:molybdopterin synthase catalytic subunit/molybdopterin converting factor small subunit
MSKMITVNLIFFASLKERAGVKNALLELPEGARVADLKLTLGQVFPGVGPALESLVVAVNNDFAYADDLVPDGAEVGLFPPVSGGTSGPTITMVTHEALDMDVLVAQITLPSTGAACIFSGMVRGETERGGPLHTSALEYEAYVPMAEAKMAQVADEIRERWPAVQGIVIVQRIGRLEVGTPTVLIGCTAGHRDTGVFEAARFGIDRLKEIVPIWKKEIGPNGETWVEGHYQPKKGD